MAWAQPVLTPEEVSKRLVARYGVEVLAVRTLDEGDRPVYAVTVMMPEDAGNVAFQIGVLYVDAETGELVPRPRPGGKEEWRTPEPGRELRRRSLERGSS